MSPDLDQEDVIASVLAEWRELRDRGEEDAADVLLRSHPKLETSLRDRIAALSLVGAALTAGAEPAIAHPPEEIGDFHIVREIGRGGMGIVYEAEQLSMRRRVALKLLHPSCSTDARAVERFRREARAAGGIHHTHVVPVYALGSENGLCWFAMELLRGRTLAEAIEARRGATGKAEAPEPAGAVRRASREGSDPWGTAGTATWYRRIAREFGGVAEALEAAHRAGIVHRDVKPSNLILDGDGTLRLTDFGLAHVRSGSTPDLTGTGALLGTPAYMSPEQVCSTRGALDGRADVYSLGATLYEVLTLRPPFPGKTVPEILAAVLAGAPTHPQRLDRRIPKELEAIVLKALEDRVERRYASANAFAKDLRAFAEGARVTARPQGPLGRTWRSIRRHPSRAGAIGILVLALGGAATYARMAARTRETERAEVTRARNRSYELLLTRQVSVWNATTAGLEDLPLDEAIALMPERPEAWYYRAMSGQSPNPLSDLDEARERGLLPGLWHVARAAVLRRMQRPAEAVAEEALATRADEAHPEVKVARAEIASYEGRNEAAERLADEVLKMSQVGAYAAMRAHHLRAEARVRRGDLDGALQDEAAVKRMAGPGVVMPYSDAYICWLLRLQGRPGSAERHLDAVLEEYGASQAASAYSDLLRGLWARGDVAAVRVVLDRGQARFPDDAGLRITRAKLLPAKEGLEALRQVLGTLSDDAPFTADARSAEASFLLDLDRAGEALPIFERLTQGTSATPDAFAGRAIALRRLGKHMEAEAVYRDGLRRWPRSAQLLSGCGWHLAALGRYQEALDLIEPRVKAHGSDVGLSDLRVALLDFLGRQQEAIPAAREVLKYSDAGHVVVGKLLYPRSSVRTMLQVDASAVLPLLQRRFAEAPMDAALREDLASALMATQQYSAAWEVVVRPPEPIPDPSWLLLRASVARRTRRWKEEVDAAQRLVDLRPEVPLGHLFLAEALVALGESARALHVLEACRERARTFRENPTSEGIRETPWNIVLLPLDDAGLRLLAVLQIKALAQLGQIEEARRVATQVRASAAGQPEILIELHRAWIGSDAVGAGRYQEAADEAREAIRLAGPAAPPSWWVHLANAELSLDDLAAARAAAERGRMDPSPRWRALALSMASQALGLDLSLPDSAAIQALELARQAIDLLPDDPYPQLARCAALARLGKWDEAAAAWDACIRMDAGFVNLPDVVLVRARIDLGRGDVVAAKRRLAEARAMRRFPNTPLAKRLADELARDIETFDKVRGPR